MSVLSSHIRRNSSSGGINFTTHSLRVHRVGTSCILAVAVSYSGRYIIKFIGYGNAKHGGNIRTRRFQLKSYRKKKIVIYFRTENYVRNSMINNDFPLCIWAQPGQVNFHGLME